MGVVLETHPRLKEFNYTGAVTGTEYHVVQGCVPIELSVLECGMEEPGILITLAQYKYDYSPEVSNANTILINPDIEAFYASLVILFCFVAVGLILTVRHIVSKEITRPIQKLRNRITKNDLEPANKNLRKEQPIVAEPTFGSDSVDKSYSVLK